MIDYGRVISEAYIPKWLLSILLNLSSLAFADHQLFVHACYFNCFLGPQDKINRVVISSVDWEP